MTKFLIFILTIILSSQVMSRNLILDDFSSAANCKWTLAKWGGRKGASYKIEDKRIILNFGKSIKKDNKGFAFYAKLKIPCDLGDYKYLSFRAKSGTNKDCSMRIFIRRENPPGKNSSFYSIVHLVPEWKNYNLRLESSSRSQAGKGLFVKTKCDPGASRQLSSGGTLSILTFFSEDAALVEIDDIELKSDIEQNSEKAEAIAKAIKEHKKYIPYQFREIISADGPLLVENGKSRFVIQIDKNSGETGKFAASQLAEYIRKSSGAELKIVNDPSPGQKVIRLSIAPKTSQKEGFRTEALNADEIVICGYDKRGLLYGVYDFLEKAFGVRWFAPFDYAEVIPTKPDVKLPLWKDESFPQMLYRRFHYCSAGRGVPDPMKHRYEAADWCVKNRYNVELERLVGKGDEPDVKKARMAKIKEFYTKRGGYIALPAMWGHNYHYWISPKEYFKKNPEYFCFDGSTKKWRAERAQLCATNPDLVKTIVRKAVEYFKKYPEREYFPFFQEDGSRLWCQCPQCMALYKGSDINSYKTEHNINLVNQIAAELAKVVPGKKIATYAYQVTTRPPVNVKPRDDVFVTYCFMDFSRPDKIPWNGYRSKELEAWNKLCEGNLVLYTYHYLDFNYTSLTPTAMIRMFRYFSLLKIKCSCQESNENWYGISAYNYYLGARLAWNPWFDEGVFRKDYYDKLYGKASSFIEEYHNILAACLRNRKYWLEYGNRTFPYVPSDKLRMMQTCLTKAENAAKGNARINKAVEAQSRGFLYVKAFSAAVIAGAEFQRTPDPAKYQLALEKLEQLDKIVKDLSRERLVTILISRTISGMRRNMRENYNRSNAFKKLAKEFDIIRTLNPWKFKTDSTGKGDQEKWFAAEFDDSKWKTIESGDFWEKQGFPNYNGTGWYRTKVEIPKSGQVSGIYFGGADERAWVYFDGKYIGGHHEGDVAKLWNEPFTIMLPSGVKPGMHQLTVKVIDSAGGGGLWKNVFMVKKK